MPLFLEFYSETKNISDNSNNNNNSNSMNINQSKTKITFMITSILGKGATSFCYKGYNMDDPSKTIYAIKIYDSSVLSAFYSETSLMSSIQNEVFLSFYHKGKGLLYKKSKKESDIKSKTVYFAIIELAENYELFDYIYYIRSGFTEKHAAEIFFKILSGMKILHSRGIAHCDIKPENVLIGKNFDIKLIDFGYSSINDEKGGKKYLYEFQSTDIYGSPEAKKSDINNGYDPIKHDLYSLGVFLFVLVLGRFPYIEYSISDKRYLCIINGDYDTFWKSFPDFNVSSEFKDLIRKLICYDPNERISVDEILKHPWLINNLGFNPENSNRNSEGYDYKNELMKRKEIVDIDRDENDKN